jgi:uncharacterized protein YoxC
MTVTEIALVAIAVAMFAIAVSMVVLVLRVLPVFDRAQLLLRRSSATLARMQRIAGDLQDMTRDARALEGRVSRTAHALLDQLEPPLRMLAAIMAGVRTAVSVLIKPAKPVA